jgi:hypothetical protein
MGFNAPACTSDRPMPSLFNGAKSGEGKVRHPFFKGLREDL